MRAPAVHASTRLVLPALLLAAALAGAAGCQPLSARGKSPPRPANQPADVDFSFGPELQVRGEVRPWTALRYENTVRQRYDYSCGAAALATLLKYYFGDPIGEPEVLRAIFVRLGQTEDPRAELADRIKNGLSMLDLLNAAKDLGYLGAVVRLPLEKLAKSPAPVIVRIEKRGFKHFVVFRGMVEDRVYLADSIRGNLRLPVSEFLKQWSGESLFLGKPGFGLPKDHPLALRVEGPPCPEREIARQAALHPW